MISVRLPHDLAKAITRHAARSFPAECCGLIVGTRDQEVVNCVAIRESENVTQGDSTKTFEVDPKLRFDTMRALDDEANGQQIVGHYHSHPNGLPTPSATDLQMAYETDLIWLICAISETTESEIAAFIPRSDRSTFDELVVRPQ